MNTRVKWHTLAPDETIAALASSPDGLTPAEARRRLDVHGPNELSEAPAPSAWSILFSQFKNVFVIVLLVAVGLSAALGEVLESVVIAVIVLFAILLGFVQEFRAERALEALRVWRRSPHR